MRSRTISSVASATVIVLLVLAATACSNSTLTADEYAAEMNALCTANGDTTDEIGEPESLEEMATMAPQFAGALDETLDSMADLAPPEELEDQANQFVELGRQLSALLNDLATAAGEGDTAAMDTISAEMAAIGEESNQVAASLGATVCITGG